MTKFIKLSNAAQDGSIYIDPDFIGMISRNRDADTFIRFKDGSYAHVLEMPNEIVEMISPVNGIMNGLAHIETTNASLIREMQDNHGWMKHDK